jgi:hypothetical protein
MLGIGMVLIRPELVSRNRGHLTNIDDRARLVPKLSLMKDRIVTITEQQMLISRWWLPHEETIKIPKKELKCILQK